MKIIDDIGPGFAVMIASMTQAIAFSFLIGVPPEISLYTAIYIVAMNAILTPSKYGQSGPNNAVSIAVGVSLTPFAVAFGGEYIGLVLAMSFMVGVIQLFFIPFSRFMDFISAEVASGMIYGIGIILVLNAIAPFSGLVTSTQKWILIKSYVAFSESISIGNVPSIATGCVTLLIGIIAKNWGKWSHRYHLTIALIGGIVFAEVLKLFGIGIYIEKLGKVDMSIITLSMPSINTETLPILQQLILPAFSIAFLGIAQTVTTMRGIYDLTGQKVNVKQTILADAIPNIAGSFLSCHCGAVSANRSYTNINVGGKTQWTAIFSAIFLLIIIKILSNVIAIIPIPAVAGLLILVAINMLDHKNAKKYFATKETGLTFVASVVATLIFGLNYAILIGMAFALIAMLRRIGNPIILIEDDREKKKIIIRIKGILGYFSIPSIEKELEEIKVHDSTVVFNITEVSDLDLEGASWLKKIGEDSLIVLKEEQKRIISCLEKIGGVKNLAFED